MGLYTYQVVAIEEGGYLASCVESPVEATGATKAEAIDALAKAIKEEMERVEAVAPPSQQPRVDIELVEAKSEKLEPDGPGDPMSTRVRSSRSPTSRAHR